MKAQKITIKHLNNNPGILPSRLGTTRVEHTHHTFIHNYPLNLIREQYNKISTYLTKFKTNFKDDIAKSPTSTRAELVYLLHQKDKLKSAIQLIHPDILETNQTRPKRGLINALGSVFKFVSGTLDASDGGRYDQAINQLQENQANLIVHYEKQLSLNRALINNYRETMRNISANFKQVENIMQITNDLIDTSVLTLLRMIISDLAAIINNLQTAISFASINILHMSIISEKHITAMRNELNKYHDPSELYYTDNILFLRTISVDYYITPEHCISITRTNIR